MNQKSFMRKLRGLLLLAACLLSISALYAKEGADQYPNGAENWFTGVLPPPGFYFVNYAGYYGGTLRNDSGQKVSLGGATPTVGASFDALRFVEITHYKILGGDYGVHIIVPIVDQHLCMNGWNKRLDVGDITIDPFILGWHRPQWHAVAALDIELPTGHYDKNDPRVSIGAHYYSFEPLVAFSYLPKSGWEASTKVMYNLKTTNPATQYHSGQEFHVDYALGKHLGPWMLGTSGYALTQTTNDVVAGQVVAAQDGMWDLGRRGGVVAVGPSVGYTTKHHVTFILQWQHEAVVKDRFGGDKFWFKMIVPTTGLFSTPKQQASSRHPDHGGK